MHIRYSLCQKEGKADLNLLMLASAGTGLAANSLHPGTVARETKSLRFVVGPNLGMGRRVTCASDSGSLSTCSGIPEHMQLDVSSQEKEVDGGLGGRTDLHSTCKVDSTHAPSPQQKNSIEPKIVRSSSAACGASDQLTTVATPTRDSVDFSRSSAACRNEQSFHLHDHDGETSIQRCPDKQEENSHSGGQCHGPDSQTETRYLQRVAQPL